MTQLELHIPPFVNYDCQTCGWCCRQYDITVAPEEYKRFQKLDWPQLEPDLAGKELFGPLRKKRATDTHRLRYTPEGACVFLSDNKCLMHRHVGELGKTIGCCVYPFTFVNTPTGVYVGCRFSCKAVAYGLGESVARREPFLRKQVELVKAGGQLPEYFDKVFFEGNRWLPWSDYLRLEETLIRMLLRDDLPFVKRLVVFQKYIDILRAAKLDNVRREKFRELLRILEDGLVAEAREEESSHKTSAMQRVLFRQYAYIFQRRHGGAYQEMDLAGRMRTRLRGLKQSVQYTFAVGRPLIPGFPASFPVAEVARHPLHPLGPKEEHALSRFMAGKLFGKQYFGRLFFRYPLRWGMTFLLLSAGAVMWYARARSLASGRSVTDYEDIVEAIRYVDYCYGSSPVPGLILERTRTRVLGMEDHALRITLAQFV